VEDQLEQKARSRWILFASVLIDSIFLVLWVGVHYLLGLFMEWVKLSGIDKWVLELFRIIFSLSTLLPIILFFYEDISIMYIRAKNRIKEEKKQYETAHNDSDR